MRNFLLLVLYVNIIVVQYLQALPSSHQHQVQQTKPLVKHHKLLSAHSHRIAGGQLASLGQFPFASFLEWNFNGEYWSYCTSSLLNEEWVLTAGHCIFDSTNEFYVHLGTVDPWNKTIPSEVVAYSNEGILHPNYSWPDNDIALIKLSEPIQFSDVIQPVTLPSRSEVDETFVWRTATSLGWGQDGDDDSSNDNFLKWVEMSVISNAECLEQTGWDILDEELCTFSGPGLSVCGGDSGGPLVVLEGSLWVQIGIPAFWDGQCPSNYPSGFTRVSSFLDWISETTGIVIP